MNVLGLVDGDSGVRSSGFEVRVRVRIYGSGFRVTGYGSVFWALGCRYRV